MSANQTKVHSADRAIFVCDEQRHRGDLVSRVVAECGARPNRIEDLAALKKTRPHDSFQIVVMGIENHLAPEHPIFDVLRSLREKGTKVVCYGEGAEHWPVAYCCEILLAGASCLLDSAKPEFLEELRKYLSVLITEETESSRKETHIKDLMKSLGAVGESASIKKVFRWAERVSALSDLPVLISGETGTGKELVASAIHRLDHKRGSGPFIVVNCSAISASLAESELFGHRRGAFTGADRDRLGLIRTAQGGVLFLDEIGEMDLNLQTKLLRALETKLVLGVGEDQETSVDVRVVAATNKDLGSLVAQNKFREDLFYRLNVLSIHIPPLRERPEDIQPLVEHFLNKYSHTIPSVCHSVESGFLEALRSMKLPGNARQLENIVRQSLAAKEDATSLSLGDLPFDVWEQLSHERDAPLLSDQPGAPTETHGSAPCSGKAEAPIRIPADLKEAGLNLQAFLAQCEKYIIGAALKRAKGNHSKAAQLLGISPRTVYNKVRKYLL